MTRSELRTLVQSMIGLTTEDTLINQGLEFGMKYFGGLHDFREMTGVLFLSTVADSSSMALFPQMLHLKMIRLLNGTQSYEIILKPQTWVLQRWPNPAALNSAKPQYCYRDFSFLYFYPVPDAIYTIAVTFSAIPDMDSDDDESDISLIDYPLACWAAGFVLDALQRWESGAQWRLRAMDAFREAMRTDKRDNVFRKHVGPDHLRGVDRGIGYNDYLDPFAGHGGRLP